MPTQLQFRRGTTAQTASFIGGVAEVTVDTDKNVVVVHDGVTSGGWPAPQLSFVQASFNTANTGSSTAQAAFNKANTANSTAQAAFDAANTVSSTAQAAFNKANTANTTAQSGFDKANTANSTAQAAFDTANTKFNSSGGTISGNITVTGNVSPTTDNVYSLGSQSYRWKDLYVGPGSIYIDNIVLSNTGGSLVISGASDIAIANSNSPSIGDLSGTANAAFDKANSANSLAQAAFNSSNTKFSSSGGTISGSLTVTGNVVVEGETTFVGNVTTIEVSTLNVADPLIYLAANNYSSDAVSIGYIGNYFDGANNQHAGVFRDPVLKEFIVMGNYQPEVEANNLINIADPTFVYANVKANFFKGDLIANAATINGYDIFSYSSSAFSKANTANTTAQAGFDKANTDFTNISIAGGTYGNTTTIPTITVLANGRVSSISSVSFTAGASISDDTSSNSTFYPLFSANTSGTPETIYVSSTKLSYNPSSGTITVVDLNTTSDVRYKENVEPIVSAIDTVKNIDGISFNWKETGAKSYGIIAQELQKVLPELVHNTERGLSVSYLPLIAILVEAVKEQQKQIDELKKS